LNHVYLLSGWGRPPSDRYLEIVEPLARTYEVEVHAPFLYGNHRLARPPIGVAESVERTVEVLASTHEPDEPFLVVGHSTGALVALMLGCHGLNPAGVFGISPLFDVDYGWFGFVRRGLGMSVRHLLGLSGPASRSRPLVLRTGLSYALNALRKPGALVRCLQDFGDIDHLGLLRSCGMHFQFPVRLLLGERDDFFDIPATIGHDLAAVFPRARVSRMSGMKSHEWCLLYPEVAAELLLAFVDEELAWKKRKE
jgi:pimeloyl-ACP methyl ester carboxylesterase